LKKQLAWGGAANVKIPEQVRKDLLDFIQVAKEG
jgi:hypothetical protein